MRHLARQSHTMLKDRVVVAALVGWLFAGVLAAAPQNYALRLGPGTELEFPHHPVMHTGADATIEYWCRKQSAAAGGISWYRYAPSAEHKALQVDDGLVYYQYAGSPWYSGAQPNIQNTFTSDSLWHHFAFVRRQSGGWSIYADGVEVVQAGPATGFGSGCWLTCNVIEASAPTRIAAFIAGATSWEIDEVHISNNERYNGPAIAPARYFTPDADTVMHLTFEEGAGSLVHDSGPAQQQGIFTASGTPTWDWVATPGPTPSSATVYGAGCGSPAQATWSQLAAAAVPAPRDNAAHCYDSARGKWVLFGGTAGTVLSDTWLFDGASWQQVATAVSPPGLRDARMVFDASRGTCILFGGRVASGSPLNDTWEWDGANWSLVSPATRPPERMNFGMCYDESRQRTIVFGGLGLGGAALGDTWEYDGTVWTQVASTGPAPRDLCAMAYDPVRAEAVLVGGRDAAGVFSDTWVWDGTSWADRAGVQPPPGSLQASLAWDPMRAKLLRFGGASAGWATSYGDVWEWDGSDWTATTRSGGGPSPRLGAMMIWDAVVGRMLLFGGRAGGINGAFYGDFWELGLSVGGTLQMVPAARPIMGSIGGALILNAPLPFGGVSLGFSDTLLGGLPLLPLSLASVGMPGCTLWHSNDIFGLPVAPTSPGTLDFSVAIPGNINLLGSHVYLQAYAIDFSASPRNLIASNGIGWLIGNQ